MYSEKMTPTAQSVQFAYSKPIIILLSLLTHYVLHKGEWDNRFHLFLGIWIVSFGGLAIADYTYNPQSCTIIAALEESAVAAMIYFTVLAISIILHRGFFHRLQMVRQETATFVTVICH
jgi:hypothetical protein